MTCATKEAPRSPKEACTHSQMLGTGLRAAEWGGGLLWGGESCHHTCGSSGEPAGGPQTRLSKSGPKCTGLPPCGPSPALGTGRLMQAGQVFHLHGLGLESCAQCIASGCSPHTGLPRRLLSADALLIQPHRLWPSYTAPGCSHTTWDICS